MLGHTEVEVPCVKTWFTHLWQFNERLALSHDSLLLQLYVTGQVRLKCILVLSLEFCAQ